MWISETARIVPLQSCGCRSQTELLDNASQLQHDTADFQYTSRVVATNFGRRVDRGISRKDHLLSSAAGPQRASDDQPRTQALVVTPVSRFTRFLWYSWRHRKSLKHARMCIHSPSRLCEVTSHWREIRVPAATSPPHPAREFIRRDAMLSSWMSCQRSSR